VLQLQPQHQASVALVTYGSPLRRLYARLFPSYVDDELLARVGAAVTAGADQQARWVNLWRDTDPIGGPVNAPARDVRLVDPTGFGFPPGDSVFPEIAGHSGYQLHPAFADAISSAALSIPVGRAPVPLEPGVLLAGHEEPGRPQSGPPQPGQPQLPEAPVLA
jgi:hypothetical protein